MSKTARTLAKGSTVRIISYIAQVIVSFFLTPFMVYSLGDGMYGFSTLVGTFIGYYGLLDFGLSYAVNRYLGSAIGAKDYDECNRVFNTTFILFLIFGLAAIFISCLLSAIIPIFVSDSEDAALFVKVILILGLNMAIELPLRVFLGVLTSQLRFDIISGLELSTLFLRTALIVLVLTMGYQVLALVVVTVLSSIPLKILTIYFAKKNMPFIKFSRKEWNLSTAKTLFSYSLYTFVFQISVLMRFKVNVIIISTFLGLSAVTHFRIGSMLADHMQSFMIAVLGYMIPVFSRLYGLKEYENIEKTFFFANKMSIYIASFIGFGLIFWGKPFIERWMGPDYLDAYPVLLILIIGLLFGYFQVPGSEVLLGTTGYKLVGIINLGEGVCNILLSLILVRYYGLEGVALGALIPTMIVKVVIQPIFVSRSLNVKFSTYIHRVTKPIIIVILTLIIPALISFYFAAPNYGVLFMLGFISITIYSASIRFFGFDLSEIAIIRNTISLK